MTSHTEVLLKAATDALDCFDTLVGESKGVAGLHLNGDLAPWSDLIEGGKLEMWTHGIADLREALAAFRAAEEAPADTSPKLGPNWTTPRKHKVEEIARDIRKAVAHEFRIQDNDTPSYWAVANEFERQIVAALSAISPSASARDEALEEAATIIEPDIKRFDGELTEAAMACRIAARKIRALKRTTPALPVHNEALEEQVFNAIEPHLGAVVSFDQVKRLIRDALRTAPVPRSGEWLPIETAPRDGSRVICWHELWTGPACGVHNGRAWIVGYDLHPFLHQPTHWQPLPAAPSASSK